MPFTAQYKDKKIDATILSLDKWNELKRSNKKKELVCPDPECNVQMIPKTYRRTGTQFFAHKTESKCPMAYGMTQEHLSLQRHVKNAVINAGWQAIVEAYLPELRHEPKRYVDVLAVSPDDPDCKVAFEIQWSYQTPETYIQRTQSYAERNIRTYWISKRHLDQSYLREGVSNAVLGDNHQSVSYNLDVDIDQIATDICLDSLENFVKKSISYEFGRKTWASNYNLTITDLEKLVKEREYLTAISIEEDNQRVDELIKRYDENEVPYSLEAIRSRRFEKEYSDWKHSFDNALSISPEYTFDFLCKSWNINSSDSPRFLNILNMIGEKRHLPLIMEILKYNPHQIGYNPYKSNLRHICESIWHKKDWHKVIYKTQSFDPRNDPTYWVCGCPKKYLEIGYRYWSNGAKNYITYCSKCRKCESGSIGKKG